MVDGLEKELVFFGSRRIKREDGKYYAGDYYCTECHKNGQRVPAIAFWPIYDVDIRPWPYCQKCIDDGNEEILSGCEKSEKARRNK